MTYNGTFLDSLADQTLRDAIRMTAAYFNADDDSKLSVELEMPRLVRRAAAQALPDFESLAAGAINASR